MYGLDVLKLDVWTLYFFIMMFELSHLISMYNILWFNSAAIIIYYICYTNVVILISEYIFLVGK